MKKILIFAVLSVAMLFSYNPTYAQTERQYISDNLTVFMHTGPSRQYRIIGSVEAGSSVTILQRSEQGDFTQIEDDQGRTAWVESQYLQNEKSLKFRVPELTTQLEDLQSQIPILQERITQLNSALASEKKQKLQQEESLKSAEIKISNLENQLETKETDIQIRWLINGGSLAIACIVLGILLSYLPKKRKRNDGWTN